MTYHHGDLVAAILRETAQVISDSGPDAVALRDLARRAGVSHAAPAHHFGDRRGLFTALATQGFTQLGEALEASVRSERFDDTAVAYVEFAINHRGHYAVMYRADLLDQDSEDLIRARSHVATLLSAGLDSVPREWVAVELADARKAAWALVHGMASLIIDGAIPSHAVGASVRAAAAQLFHPR